MPPKPEEIINKALKKDRDVRCQSGAERRADLRRLKRDTESGKATAISIRADVILASQSGTAGTRHGSGWEAIYTA